MMHMKVKEQCAEFGSLNHVSFGSRLWASWQTILYPVSSHWPHIQFQCFLINIELYHRFPYLSSL